MDLMLARVVWSLHFLVMIWIAIVWSLPWSWAWWAALIGNPIVQLNWWIFDNRCALSVLEERLRARAAGGAVIPADDGQPLEFVSGVLSRILGRPVSRGWGSAVSYTFLWGGFAIATARLVAPYR